jgi:predicted DNA-binding protein (UPF0251 family)
MPCCTYYKPQAVPLSVLQQVSLTVDEFEAIRLADLEGLYQADAAEKMNVSRQTLGRILESAHKKIADALVNGKALAIEGGAYELDPRIAASIPPAPHRYRKGHGHGAGHGRRRRGQ